MKKTFYSFLLLGFVLLSSCSSVKVLDSWKGDNLATMSDKNILVIARTDNQQARIAIEEAMANDLRKAGLKATESYLKFNSMNPNKKVDPEKVQAMIDGALKFPVFSW